MSPYTYIYFILRINFLIITSKNDGKCILNWNTKRSLRINIPISLKDSTFPVSFSPTQLLVPTFTTCNLSFYQLKLCISKIYPLSFVMVFILVHTLTNSPLDHCCNLQTYLLDFFSPCFSRSSMQQYKSDHTLLCIVPFRNSLWATRHHLYTRL